MEVKKLEHVDSTVVANGVVAMGCDSDNILIYPYIKSNISKH